MSSFKTEKGLEEIIDFSLYYGVEFAKDLPIDQIAVSAWEVTYGSIVIDSDRVVGTDRAIARVSGGEKLYSTHEIRNTVTCVSGQKYVRTIEIEITQVQGEN